MEGHADLGDWEILLGPEVGEDLKPLLEGSEDGPQNGAFKSDYFSIDSQKRCHGAAAVDGDIREDMPVESPGAADAVSGNLSWIDPESVSRFFDRPKAEHVFQGIGLPRGDLGRFWSDESSDGRRSRPGSEMGELGDTGELEIREITDGHKETETEVGLEGKEEREVGLEKLDEEEPGECVKIDECSDFSAEMGEKGTDPKNDLTGGTEAGEKTVMAWWKIPFELLKFCAFRVKPVWSISIAAAILGVLMLRKRLHRMKHKNINIPLNLSMDQQKTSQLKIRAARLSEAFSVVRRVPLVRASLPSGGLTSWSVAGLLQ